MMNSEVQKPDFMDTIAKIVSVVFHPLFMPVYGFIILMSAGAPFSYLPFGVKRLIVLIVVINNVLLPISIMPLLMQLKFIDSWTLREREERAVPMIITTILYATTSYIIYRFPVPGFLKVFIFSGFLLSLVLIAVNFRWKISLHAVGAGAITALIMLLMIRMMSPFLWLLVATSVMSGLVMSSRLKLNLHSPAQVWGGFCTGLIGFLLLMVTLHQLA